MRLQEDWKRGIGTLWTADYQKAYVMVLQSWITECLVLLEIADNIKEFKTDSMKGQMADRANIIKWMGNIKIRIGIF